MVEKEQLFKKTEDDCKRLRKERNNLQQKLLSLNQKLIKFQSEI